MTVLHVEHLQVCMSSCSVGFHELKSLMPIVMPMAAYRRPPTLDAPIPFRDTHAVVGPSALVPIFSTATMRAVHLRATKVNRFLCL